MYNTLVKSVTYMVWIQLAFWSDYLRVWIIHGICFNPLTGTLKSQSNEPLYSNTVIGTLAVDLAGWLLHWLLHLVQLYCIVLYINF